jgi:hypothetical protein
MSIERMNIFTNVYVKEKDIKVEKKRTKKMIYKFELLLV